MDIVAQLSADMKAAMKAGEKQRLSVIRMLLSDAQVADMKKITPQQAVEAYAKKLVKSAEEFQKYGKPDQVAQLQQELAIVQQYLPKKATPEQTDQLIDNFLSQNSFTEKQLGQAMGALMKAHGGELDAAIANPILRRKLAGR